MRTVMPSPRFERADTKERMEASVIGYRTKSRSMSWVARRLLPDSAHIRTPPLTVTRSRMLDAASFERITSWQTRAVALRRE